MYLHIIRNLCRKENHFSSISACCAKISFRPESMDRMGGMRETVAGQASCLQAARRRTLSLAIDARRNLVVIVRGANLQQGNANAREMSVVTSKTHRQFFQQLFQWRAVSGRLKLETTSRALLAREVLNQRFCNQQPLLEERGAAHLQPVLERSGSDRVLRET